MNNMKDIKRKGFTLVELLIVIVVIGILSAMMMLSNTEAVSSAKANNIVSNLRNWKTAALSWYVDNIDRVTPAGKVKNESGTGENDFAHSGVTMDIAKYLSNTFEATSDTRFVKDSAGGRYYVDHIEKSGKYVWYIGYEMPTDDKNLQAKLEARAGSAGGLYSKHFNEGLQGTYKASSNKPRWVCIEVIDFTK